MRLGYIVVMYRRQSLSFSCVGHARPLITLCARFVKLRPDVHITFLTTDTFFDRARAELARSFEDGDEAAQRAR